MRQSNVISMKFKSSFNSEGTEHHPTFQLTIGFSHLHGEKKLATRLTYEKNNTVLFIQHDDVTLFFISFGQMLWPSSGKEDLFNLLLRSSVAIMFESINVLFLSTLIESHRPTFQPEALALFRIRVTKSYFSKFVKTGYSIDPDFSRASRESM